MRRIAFGGIVPVIAVAVCVLALTTPALANHDNGNGLSRDHLHRNNGSGPLIGSNPSPPAPSNPTPPVTSSPPAPSTPAPPVVPTGPSPVSPGGSGQPVAAAEPILGLLLAGLGLGGAALLRRRP